MDRVNGPYCVSIRTNSGAVIAFSSIIYDQFAAHGSDVGLGPTSVGHEADRVGATQPIGFTYVDSRAFRALDEAPHGSGGWSSEYFPNTVEFIPHRGKGCLGEGWKGIQGCTYLPMSV